MIHKGWACFLFRRFLVNQVEFLTLVHVRDIPKMGIRLDSKNLDKTSKVQRVWDYSDVSSTVANQKSNVRGKMPQVPIPLSVRVPRL